MFPGKIFCSNTESDTHWKCYNCVIILCYFCVTLIAVTCFSIIIIAEQFNLTQGIIVCINKLFFMLYRLLSYPFAMVLIVASSVSQSVCVEGLTRMPVHVFFGTLCNLLQLCP